MNSSTEKNVESDKRTGFEQDLDHLRKVPLFQGLDYECLKLIAMLCRQIDIIEGDRLMVQGEDDGCAYYLVTGNLQIFHRQDDVDYPLKTLKPGQFVGGLGLMGKTIRLFTVQATEKSTLLRLHRDNFQKVMEQFAGNMTRIAANLASELTDWEQDILNLTERKELEDGNQVLGISLL
ncbi:MAG: cyclic nucleotide-binding domain-containing protein [Desulfocapsaceae bacterium]